MQGRFCNSDVSADVPHADGASNSTKHEKEATAELVNKEEEPDQGDDGLDNTKDTGRQK